MTAPLYVDISAWQPYGIDWQLYKKWSEQWDGVSHVAMRTSYGTGYVDQHFQHYRAGALAAGIDVIIYYHYAYPQFNSPEAEANWQRQVVGNIRSSDILMLDYEEDAPQATADWAYRWLARQAQNYGKLPTLYASDAYIRARLQDARLAKFPLTLANWQFNPNERPACPAPWRFYDYLQYTDNASIPGIPGGGIDANVYLGREITPMVDAAFLNSYWNLLGAEADFTTGLAKTWADDVSLGKWRGVPLGKEGKVIWKGQEVPWLVTTAGFYTDESGVHYWHSNG